MRQIKIIEIKSWVVALLNFRLTLTMNLKLGGKKWARRVRFFKVKMKILDLILKSNLKSTLESTVSSSRIKRLRRDWKTTM